MITLQHLHNCWRESVSSNIIMLAQGNIARVPKLSVLIGESGRGSDITLRNNNSPFHNSPDLMELIKFIFPTQTSVDFH